MSRIATLRTGTAAGLAAGIALLVVAGAVAGRAGPAGGVAAAGPAAPARPAVLPATLLGAWKTISTDTASNTRARWTVAIYPDTQFAFSQGNVLFFDDGRITVHGNRIAFTERIAKGERCAGAQRVGTYTWKIAAKLLTLTALNDPCRWRREILTAQPLAWSAR